MRRSKAAYRHFVCPICFQQLNKCTCAIPPMELIHIDEGIQECVRKLNEKGYITTGSCESHYGRIPEVSICFLINYEELSDLPPGAKNQKSKCAIYFPNESETKEEFNRVKAENLKIFLSWIENLPESRYKFRRQGSGATENTIE